MQDLLKRIGFDPSRALPDELDESLFALAADELASGEVRPGLMAKAFSDAEGEEKKAEALYLRLRVAQLRREYEAAMAAIADEARQRGANRLAPPRSAAIDKTDPEYQQALDAASRGSMRLAMIGIGVAVALMILLALIASAQD